MPRNPGNLSARRWCFTLHDYTPLQEERIQALAGDCPFLCYGREVCPDTARPHLQGYIEFRNAKSLARVKELLGAPTAHLEVARGNRQSNHVYCTKSDPIAFVHGDPGGGQGNRTDIAGYVAAITEGATISELLVSHPEQFVKYHGAYEKIRFASMVHRDPANPPDVRWFYGESGAGKTQEAARIGGDDCYWKPPGRWWDGYEGQRTVILDEFRPDWWSFNYLLRLLDRYPLSVEIKGGTRVFNSPIIIITCNRKYDELYEGERGENLRQLERRVGTSVRFQRGVHGVPLQLPDAGAPLLGLVPEPINVLPILHLPVDADEAGVFF